MLGDHDAIQIHTGGCHCGAVRVRLMLSRSAQDTPIRACDCTFCRGHGAVTVTDPGGHVEIVLREAAAVEHYRFALRTADFLVCRTCGVYVAAIADGAGGLKATINVNALDDRAAFGREAERVSYDGENAAARRARRAERWTPAVLRSEPG